MILQRGEGSRFLPTLITDKLVTRRTPAPAASHAINNISSCVIFDVEVSYHDLVGGVLNSIIEQDVLDPQNCVEFGIKFDEATFGLDFVVGDPGIDRTDLIRSKTC